MGPIHIKVNTDRLPEPRLPPTRDYHTPPDVARVLFREEMRDYWEEKPKTTGPFTPQEDEDIKRMRREGFTMHQISVELNRHIGVIKSRMLKLGVK